MELLITTSRRTSLKVINKINVIAKEHSIIKEVFHPVISNAVSYLRNLSIAKEIIVTGDSMSMLSEALKQKTCKDLL